MNISEKSPISKHQHTDFKKMKIDGGKSYELFAEV